MTIKEHIEYWNKWIEHWYDLALAHKDADTMPAVQVKYRKTKTSWPVLEVLDGTNSRTTKEWAWKFFPEPYWGIPDSNKLNGVFINFNPGAGGHSQHIKTANEYYLVTKLGLDPFACHSIWEHNPRNSYYETIKQLYRDSTYPTTDWMKKNREVFIKRITENFNPQFHDSGDFVMFELCPLHTTKVNGKVYKYIHSNSKLIDHYIIDFAFECAKKTIGLFQNLIIAHGLDEITVKNKCKIDTLIHTKESDIPTGGKPWKIDVYTKKSSGVYLINFKNSSNGFPSMTEDLRKLIKRYII